DIRMVVDALDLCYTKAHVNTFVIISGDSDFSPLVSKLRENAKTVIGVGVKQSTSDLLIANCDEFIFYDDLVRERDRQRQAARRGSQPQQKRAPEESARREEKSEAKKTEAIEMVVETFEALIAERGDSGKIWASLLKDTLKRRRPDFNETYYGFRSFGNLIEEAKARGLLEFGRDEKSGAYVYRASGAPAQAAHAESATLPEAQLPVLEQDEEMQMEQPAATPEPRRRSRGGRQPRAEAARAAAESTPEQQEAPVGAQEEQPRSGRRSGRRGERESVAVAQPADAAPEAQAEPGAAGESDAAPAERTKRARKTPARVAKAKAQKAAGGAEQPAAPAEAPAEAVTEEKPKRARKSAPRRAKTH
ncbi:MAG TPA: NYN domain-containing protein, partial [Telluria sp.]|nr:NYN domain-containing protein [Telluria sp.]